MFAAMNPSGPAAQSLRTRSGSSLLQLSVVGPVHGGFFHSQLSKSSSHASTSAARVKQRTSSACKAASAHSSSSIESSLIGFSMEKIFRRVLRVRARVRS